MSVGRLFRASLTLPFDVNAPKLTSPLSLFQSWNVNLAEQLAIDCKVLCVDVVMIKGSGPYSKVILAICDVVREELSVWIGMEGTIYNAAYQPEKLCGEQSKLRLREVALGFQKVNLEGYSELQE